MKRLIILPLLILGACAHVNPPPPEIIALVDACTDDIRQAEQSRYASRVNQQAAGAKDANSLALMVMANALADSHRGNPFAVCDDAIVSHYAAETQSVTSANRTVGRGIGVGGGVLGAKWIAESLVDLGNGGGASINNSRVVTHSSDSSASGTGLGIGNTQGGSDTVGGLYPRSQMDTVATDNGTNSNSGEATINQDVPADIVATPLE